MRCSFTDMEQKSKDLTKYEHFQQQARREHKRFQFYDDVSDSCFFSVIS